MATLAGSERRSEEPSMAAAGILLGVGLGGFVDGIVLHQILQWHHLLSTEGSFPEKTVGGLEDNTLADGLFHAATWLASAVGVGLLWRDGRRHGGLGPGRVLLGWALVGWGAFNLLEGVVDHHLLEIHHVRPGAHELAWDLAFLALGAFLVAVGWELTRRRSGRLEA